MNRPQGTPSNAWPITRTASESAFEKRQFELRQQALDSLTKKEMKIVAFMRTSASSVVRRYPRRLVIGPCYKVSDCLIYRPVHLLTAMKTPTKAPH